jgi:hypothetical protein
MRRRQLMKQNVSTLEQNVSGLWQAASARRPPRLT